MDKGPQTGKGALLEARARHTFWLYTCRASSCFWEPFRFVISDVATLPGLVFLHAKHNGSLRTRFEATEPTYLP